MKAPLRIETARLVLTPPIAADADAIFARYSSDPEVTRYLGWPQHHSVVETNAFLTFSAAEWNRWPAGPYLIRARRDGRLLGGTGLAFERANQAMTGYVLAKDAWGQGYATEALRAMVDVARAVGVTRLYALCHPQHQPSMRVLEKCGFTRDSKFDSRDRDPILVGEVPHSVNAEIVRVEKERVARERIECADVDGATSLVPNDHERRKSRHHDVCVARQQQVVHGRRRTDRREARRERRMAKGAGALLDQPLSFKDMQRQVRDADLAHETHVARFMAGA